jgi:uncharacterized protein (DUF983 family)
MKMEENWLEELIAGGRINISVQSCSKCGQEYDYDSHGMLMAKFLTDGTVLGACPKCYHAEKFSGRIENRKEK